jgi:cytochrome bd ubiquinol oxidase subunit II
MDFLTRDILVLIFAALMGIAIMAYVILDGYDLGVGVLLPQANGHDRDQMIHTIAPFWDANETWLVLGAGILLVAFPIAHGIILNATYLAVLVMLIGLILRGVSFELREKASAHRIEFWNQMFAIGSATAGLAQGFMLGHFVVAFRDDAVSLLFAALVAPCVLSAYTLMGASWLILKTEGELQHRAARWGYQALWLTALGILLVSLATPAVSPRIFARWFSVERILIMSPIPIVVMGSVIWLSRWFKQFDADARDHRSWIPFVLTVGLFLLSGLGLAYSTFPYVVIDQLTIWDAAASTATLKMVLLGVVFVLPPIIAYSAFSYRIFRGKSTHLFEA